MADKHDCGPNFHKLHLPTARVAFEEAQLFAIRELAITAPRSKTLDEATATLDECLQTFKEYRTWV